MKEKLLFLKAENLRPRGQKKQIMAYDFFMKKSTSIKSGTRGGNDVSAYGVSKGGNWSHSQLLKTSEGDNDNPSSSSR